MAGSPQVFIIEDASATAEVIVRALRQQQLNVEHSGSLRSCSDRIRNLPREDARRLIIVSDLYLDRVQLVGRLHTALQASFASLGRLGSLSSLRAAYKTYYSIITRRMT